jgi:hypothetical protein
MKNSEIGSFLAGIGATEDIDSSGEIIEIKGIDHSSLLKDGKVHFEHKNDNSSQVIGKIVDCKKILKESDCEHELHKYFWEKARKRPYMYVAAVLFDKMGHQGAKDALAQAKFDQHLDTDKTNGMSWWSIEGSRLDKEGNRIKKCIARDWAYTHRPCNKACIAELLTDEQADKFIPQIAKKKVQDSMKKSMAEEADLKKSGTKYFKQLARVKNVKTGQKSTRDYTPITTATGEHREGIKTQPKRIFSSMAEAPERAKVGDRILHNKPKVRSGASIYKDPETWKKEIDTENPLRKAVKTKIMRKKEDKYHIYEGKQRITSTPLSLKEINEKHGGAKKIESSGYRLIPHKEENGLTSMKKNKILKSIINETWDVFKHKDLLIETIKKNQPHLSQEDVLNVAKTYVYIDMKKQENELEDLFEKSKKGRCWEGYEPTPGKKPYSKGSCQPIKKAKVGEGKTKVANAKEEVDKKEKPFHNYNPKKHSVTGGLNDKARKKINREEGSNLKRPVTGKVKAGSKAAKRRKSFCARMSGVKGPTSKDGKLTPKGASLKRWGCNKNEEV